MRPTALFLLLVLAAPMHLGVLAAEQPNAGQWPRWRGLQIQGILDREFGQQGTLIAVWAIKGSRPTVVRQHGRKSIWVFVAVEPATGWSMAMP